MNTVKSGIGLSSYDIHSGQLKPTEPGDEKVLTSRTARVLLAGAGFLADAYDLFVINLVLRLLKDQYPEYVQSGQIHQLEGSVAAAALFGSIVGQIVAGSMADVIGRKKIFVVTAALISVGSLGSAFCTNTKSFSVYSQICFWRIFLGLGVGGEYPLAATLTSESSSATSRGSLMSAVFAMQGVGSLLSVVVVMSCLSLGYSTDFTWRFALAFGAVPAMIAFPWRLRMHETESYERLKKQRAAAVKVQGKPEQMFENSHLLVQSNVDAGQYGVREPKIHNGEESGTVTASSVEEDLTDSVAVYLQQRRQDAQEPVSSAGNPTLYSRSIYNHIQPEQSKSTSSSPSSAADVIRSRIAELRNAWQYYKFHILGTAMCWFLLDVIFYANGIFNHDVTATILSSGSAEDSSNGGEVSESTTAMEDAYHAMILCLFGIPGYWLSVLYIDTVGRKNIQLLGFAMMAILFCVCNVCYDVLLRNRSSSSQHYKYAYLLIYSCTFLFSNFGPNTTTFVIPGEIYPSEVRATCHGISAAAGKLGAATGAFFFPLILGAQTHSTPTRQGLKQCMIICAIVACLGFLCTYWFIPYYGSEELVDENHYYALSHSCLLPPPELLELKYRAQRKAHPHFKRSSLLIPKKAKSRSSDGSIPYQQLEMTEVVESCNEYGMGEEEGDLK